MAEHAIRAGAWFANGGEGHILARAFVAGYSLEAVLVVSEDRIVVKTIFWVR